MTDLQTLLALYAKIGVQCVVNELGDGIQSVGIGSNVALSGCSDGEDAIKPAPEWASSETEIHTPGYWMCEKIAYHKNIVGYNDFYCVHFFKDGQLIKVGIWE